MLVSMRWCICLERKKYLHLSENALKARRYQFWYPTLGTHLTASDKKIAV